LHVQGAVGLSGQEEGQEGVGEVVGLGVSLFKQDLVFQVLGVEECILLVVLLDLLQACD
jgi:hypothetical protein